MKKLSLIIAVIVVFLACAPSTANGLWMAKRTRIVGPRGAFNPLAISHPSGGWTTGFLTQKAGIAKMTELTWKVKIVVNGEVDQSEYPRKSNGMFDVAVFRTRHDSNYRRHECLIQTLSGISFQPGTEAEFVLDVSRLVNPFDALIFEHYRGYSVYLDAYDSAGNVVPLNGNGGVMAGSTPYVPSRLQSLTALIKCE